MVLALWYLPSFRPVSELKQAIQMAFDVVIGRGGNISEVNQLITTINDRLKNENKYSSKQVIEFIAKLSGVDEEDQKRICHDLKSSFMSLLTHEKIVPHLPSFLKMYEVFVDSGIYSFEHAETIADRMERIFKADIVPEKIKAKALELAINAAFSMNRFAAMDTCSDMIKSVSNDKLGSVVVGVMQHKQHSFITEIEPSQCNCETVRRALISYQQ